MDAAFPAASELRFTNTYTKPTQAKLAPLNRPITAASLQGLRPTISPSQRFIQRDVGRSELQALPELQTVPLSQLEAAQALPSSPLASLRPISQGLIAARTSQPQVVPITEVETMTRVDQVGQAVSTQDIGYSNQARSVYYLELSGNIEQGLAMLQDSLMPADDKVCCLISKDCQSGLAVPLGKMGNAGMYLVVVGGVAYALKRVNRVKVEIYVRQSPPSDLSVIDDLNSLLCLTGGQDVFISKYVAMDEFSNECLITYLLNVILAGNVMPDWVVRHHSASLCNTTGLIVEEYCDLGTLDDFAVGPTGQPYRDSSVVIDGDKQYVMDVLKSSYGFEVFKQVLCSLHYLQEVCAFVHGDLKVKSVSLRSVPCEYEYQGIPISSPFTVKLSNLDKSSITIFNDNKQPYRIYSDNVWADGYFKVFPFKLKVGNTTSAEQGAAYYVIDDLLNATVYGKARHIGVPFYRTFDLYTFIMSVMLLPELHYLIVSNPFMKRLLWDSLWLGMDGEEAMMRVKDSMGSGYSFERCISLLKGLRLRCGILEEIILALPDEYMPDVYKR